MPEIIPNFHPIFVHFTVALLSISTGIFVVLQLFQNRLSDHLRQQLTSVAYWNLWLGAGITIITVVAGFQAYNTVVHDGPSHAAMTDHRNWAVVTAALFLAVAIWSMIRFLAGEKLGGLFVTLLLIAQLALLSTAWRGGELVYRYGLGVMSLPQSEGEGHAHSHSHGEGDGGHEHGGKQAAEHNEMMDFDGMDEMMESEGDSHDHAH